MRAPALISRSGFTALLISLLAFNVQPSLATQWITYTNTDGETLYLDNDRQPSLYTGDYGDCQGDSAITATRWNAAYYKDNMTISFNIEGFTAVANESVMLYIGVYAYGENRFNMTFDPCFANIYSMCPINASVPIAGSGIIPIAPADVAGIPDIALSIPDFEGQAILRVFGNSTQSQIACYSAVLRNGNSFSHPAAVGGTVGFFVAIAFISSVATAVYGQGLQETRKHYAHSLSIFVVFSVLQHVFYTGALSTNFPSVLPAFWSNFAWASGMIHSASMQNAINEFVGNNRGNISSLGSAPTGQSNVDLGGGYSLSSIYKRTVEKRALANSTSGFSWYGHSVEPGLPLPGNYSSFAGTLGELQIPASNAFLTGLLWLLILIAIMLGFVVVLKAALELLAAVKVMKTDRLAFFRRHWIYCAGIVVLRSCFIAFFMMIFLSLFQFTIGGGSGVLAIAGIVFCLFLIGMLGISAYALWYRLSGQKARLEQDRLQLKSNLRWVRASTVDATEDSRKTIASLPWRHLQLKDSLERPHVHDDDDYLIKFGWLSARFRRSKWWFFAAWLIYEFVRACFYGAAAGSPLTQVFGLLAWEILSLFAIVMMRPFESNRLNMLMVYFLGFSKVVSVALCAAFDPRFGLDRILTTVIGVVIIVIQGILIICTLIAVVIGAVSSWMSVRRYKEKDKFHPSRLANRRTKYFAHIDQKAADKPLPKSPKSEPVQKSSVSEEPKEPYFSVADVRRQTKIEDEDPENENNLDDDEDQRISTSMDANRQLYSRPPSRAPSMRSRTSISNLPYGARRHRASWSTNDFANAGYEPEQIPSGMQPRMSIDSFRGVSRDPIGTPNRKRASSNRQSWTNDPSLVDIPGAANDRSVSSYRGRHRSLSISQNQLQSRYVSEEPAEVRPTTSVT
ncbi:hypothetical protein LTR70_009462 [Exophiala xenobiotica]|uniref:ML-like domain-containing protein n=1 Tax=Lithohypha guttulata TaxID=1690604 RepID=A0ABR0JXM5_9EURO|nr:hypothetical protein LTR24_009231 [Lithohypha guttulata]KAK5310470.1 hypothetical protein LTR70_009462 [Exophiala xenobiotica]